MYQCKVLLTFAATAVSGAIQDIARRPRVIRLFELLTSGPTVGDVNGTLSRMRDVPSYRTAVRQSTDGPEGSFPGVPRYADDPPTPGLASLPSYNTMVQTTADDIGKPRPMWPPSTVVKEDRGKATATWMLLLATFLLYIGFVVLNSFKARKNPPVQIARKDEPFTLPDVVFCPSPGDGCNANYGSACLPMNWYLSSLEGLSGCDKFFATPSPAAAATPSPTPGSKPVSLSSTISPTAASRSFTESESTADDTGDDYGYFYSDSSYPSAALTPSPVVLPAIRVNVETTAHEWCPKVPLSECAIDYDGIRSGDVRSLHASFYVLWDDKDSSDTLPGTRRFINTFFVDQEESVTDAVVAVRLPYDRVNITGTDPFTFLSNDVILSMSQYVHLDLNGNTGSTERTYTQATTTAQHTLRLDTFDGEAYEGALLYVTLSVNKFAYQSIEEVDPVDWWTLVGSIGGIWEIICVLFGTCFVAIQVVGPDKKWGWATFIGSGGGKRDKRSTGSDTRTSQS